MTFLGVECCEITLQNRKKCKFCRYQKCLEVGMKPELVDVNVPSTSEKRCTTDQIENEDKCDTGENVSGTCAVDMYHQYSTKTDEDIEVSSFNASWAYQNCIDSDQMIFVEDVLEQNQDEPENSKNIKLMDQENETDDFSVVPFKKREQIKDWLPYCTTFQMEGSPEMKLTTEESLFISHRVGVTRELVYLLHENCMKVRKDGLSSSQISLFLHCTGAKASKNLSFIFTYFSNLTNNKHLRHQWGLRWKKNIAWIFSELMLVKFSIFQFLHKKEMKHSMTLLKEGIQTKSPS